MNLRHAAPLLTVALLAGCQSAPIPPAAASVPTPALSAPSANEKRPVVQVAILLDTSGSMSGLIDQTKAQLWKIVNEFGAASQNGQSPRLEVALYEYGKSSVSGQSGHVRQILGFTGDLDSISEELFKLTTDGGDEYCGWAVRSALHDLKWSQDPKTLKVIFIAGNEPFTQGPVAFGPVMQEAVQRGILVNTIYCGDKLAGIQEGWQGGAVAGQGRFLVIDHQQAVAYQQTPQDQKLAELSSQLNSSYVAYGASGGAAMGRQAKMDSYSNAVSPAIAAERAQVKACAGSYSNAGWDLVDAVAEKKVDVKNLKAEELPAEMQKLSADDRERYVATKQQERARIQAEIQALSKARVQYLAQHASSDKGTLQSAVIETVRVQATSKGYQFKK